jgi:tetratricopeptide (TPR) repeat protein
MARQALGECLSRGNLMLCKCFLTLVAMLAIISVGASLLIAQSGINQTSGPAPQINKPIDNVDQKTDFSSTIDPLSVKDLSDEDLDRTFDRMVSEYSKNAVLLNNIGATYYSRKRYEKAESAFRRAIILNNHPAFLTNLSIVYDAQKRIPEAIAAAQRAVIQSPRYARARTQLCELMMVSKQNHDAVLCYGELGKITQLDPLSQTFYALVTLRDGEPDKAISMISVVMNANQPTSQMFNILGKAYFEKKRYSQSANAFKEAVQIDPNNPQLRYNLAMSLTASDDRAGALSQYNLMKESDPDLADQLYRILYRDKIIYVNEATATIKPPR